MSDPEKRVAFDNNEIDSEGNPTAKQSFYRGRAEGPQVYRYYRYSPSAPENDVNLDEILGGMFGKTQRNASWFTERSAPTLYALDVEFLDAVDGKNLTVTLPDGEQASVNIPAGTDSDHITRATVTPSAKDVDPHSAPMVQIRASASHHNWAIFNRGQNRVFFDNNIYAVW